MVDFGPDILDTEVSEVEPLDVDISSEPQHELTTTLSSGAANSSSPVVFDFSLQSRVEVILNAIINDLVYGEHPKSRVEQILLYILGEENELPKPHSRVEELLIDLALELESTDISPKSRVEQILLVLLNQPYEFPITHSRVEELLIQLQTHVSEVTGPLPLTINSDGTALIDYRIYGNTEQAGTPTPENPIMPEGVGERTENLFNGNSAYSRISEKSTVEFQSGTLVVSNGYGVYFDIDITTNTNYSIKVNPQDSTGYLAFTAVLLPSNTRAVGYHNTLVSARFNSGSDNKIQMVFYSGGSASSECYSVYSDIMLTKSYTPPTSYIPYGYKLPMVSRGENLWDSELEQGSFDIGSGTERNASDRIRSGYIHIQNSDNYTITLTGAKGVVVYVYDANKSYLYAESSTDWQKCPFTREIEANRYVRFAFAKSASGNYDDITPSDVSNIMLVKGSTVPDSYIPYYREETPIYLGESQTTRRIKKLVLTGEENVNHDTFFLNRYIIALPYLPMPGNKVVAFCTHYLYDYGFINKRFYITARDAFVYFNDNSYNNAEDFKQFLRDQYAAGTPVTVWYVLAEPETGIVNEPLMKIGDYTDTISMEQAGVSIPTIKGTTVIDYDGTPKPSQMYVKYNKS